MQSSGLYACNETDRFDRSKLSGTSHGLVTGGEQHKCQRRQLHQGQLEHGYLERKGERL